MAWSAVYATDLQGCWALLPVPALYLAARALGWRPRGSGVLPSGAQFVDVYAVAFAIETLIDPLVTGPLLRSYGYADTPLATTVMVGFVLLGDFRVYLLVFALLAVAQGRRWGSAVPVSAAWTMVVPLVAYPLATAVRAAWPAADPNTIWLVYEVSFALLAWILRGVLPRRVAAEQPALRAYLGAVLTYVTVYYALWATADALIQLAGVDLGWLLRIVPNQLYYAFWIPFVVWRFFAPRYAATRASHQASR